jgi:hypothetical protein
MYPQEFSIAPHFYPICLANFVLLSHMYLGQRGETWHFKIEPSNLRGLRSLFFFEWWANQMLLIWGIICGGGLDKKSLQLECTLYTYICSLSPANSWMELAAQVMQSEHTLHRHICMQCPDNVQAKFSGAFLSHSGWLWKLNWSRSFGDWDICLPYQTWLWNKLESL